MCEVAQHLKCEISLTVLQFSIFAAVKDELNKMYFLF